MTAEQEHVSGSVTDVGHPGAVKRLFEDVRTNLGGLDVLVDDAGIAGPTAQVGEYDAEAFAAVMRVNLQGTFLVTQRAVPLLVESGAGSIVTMSSLAGRFGYPNRIGYSTTKWGLVGFAKTLAMELGPLGVTSNTVHPGAVEGIPPAERLPGARRGLRTHCRRGDRRRAGQSVGQAVHRSR